MGDISPVSRTGAVKALSHFVLSDGALHQNPVSPSNITFHLQPDYYVSGFSL